jgi:serine/threonine protein phosphatase PrpC
MDKKLVIFFVSCITTFFSHGSQQSYEVIPKNRITCPLAAVDSREHRRPYQEDTSSRRMVAGGAWYAVFDGHGGSEVALFLKENLHKFFAEAQASTIEEKMKLAFKRADEHPFVRSREMVGSTASVAFIKDGNIHFAHVGDSRMGLKKGPDFSHITVDHGVNNEAEVSRIDKLNEAEKEGLSVDRGKFIVKGCRGNIAVSRSIGDYRFNKSADVITAQPEYFCVPFGPENDFLVLASDGMWGYVNNLEILAKLHCHEDKSAAALAKGLGDMVQHDNQKDDKADNATIMVVDLHTQYEKRWSTKMKSLLFGGSLSIAALFAWLCYKSAH